MSWLTASGSELGITAGKAALMYGTALIGLRLGERRTFAQWTLIDYVVAVAVGAIVGRTATAGTQSYAVGAVALVTLIAVHRLISLARFRPGFRRLVDHRVRVLATAGRFDPRQLRRCGLTEDDLLAALRERGVFDLDQVHYLLYEVKGGLTVVPPQSADDDFVTAALRTSAKRGFTST